MPCHLLAIECLTYPSMARLLVFILLTGNQNTIAFSWVALMTALSLYGRLSECPWQKELLKSHASISSLKLLARWIVFTTPLKDVVKLQREKGAPFTGCSLCISQDGTIAVLDLVDRQL